MDIRSAYDRWSETYDTGPNLTRDLDSTATRAVLGNWHFHTILELGCGTGKNTRLFSRIGERVVAVDFSAGMLKVARWKAASGRVSFCAADLNRPWPFLGLQAGLVTCNLVLEHMADLVPVFSQSFQVLSVGGMLFVCELHPFRQYLGKKARFQVEAGTESIEVPAFVHHVSDFLDAAEGQGFKLERLQEWWHEADQGEPPRLVSFVFRK